MTPQCHRYGKRCGDGLYETVPALAARSARQRASRWRQRQPGFPVARNLIEKDAPKTPRDPVT
jgi:hypothetical protein